ncbi:MAG: c-type cytochrome [Propylenella sp.]
MRTLKVTTFSLLMAALSGTALASDDPIDSRQKLMLSNAAAAGAAVAMIRGDTPFNVVVANAVLATMNAVAYTYGDYFPEGSDKGNTEASPKIWEDMAGFQAILAKFQKDTDAAVAAKPQDLDSFKAAFGAAAQNCNTCHESYRIEKK